MILSPRQLLRNLKSRLQDKILGQFKANDPGLEAATDADVCTYYVLPGLSPMVQSPELKSPSAGTGARNSTKLQRRENLTSSFDMTLFSHGHIQLRMANMANVATTAVDWLFLSSVTAQIGIL